jgi:citrate lyase subunit beta/citryl-CoA lyase
LGVASNVLAARSKRLVEAGLVERKVSPDDARVRLYRLSTQGRHRRLPGPCGQGREFCNLETLAAAIGPKMGRIDVLVQDLEDFTPPAQRMQARARAHVLFQRWRDAGAMVCVRINPLETEGYLDLQAVMPARPDIIAYPKTAGAFQVRALDMAIATHEAALGIERGTIEILPVCETALGVACVREIAGASARVRCALLGAEDLAADLCAERSRTGDELDYARRRFLLECRAAAIEPVDAPYTFADVEGAVEEARKSRRLGYKTKSAVRPEHAARLREVLAPSSQELAQARKLVTAFEAARQQGDDRALVDGQWVEVPTYRNALRLLAAAH